MGISFCVQKSHNCLHHIPPLLPSSSLLPLPPHLSSAGRFTDLPSNMTVKEGQNIEMACAFQSGTASVYLEIQWWFVKAPEPTDSEEDVDPEEVQGAPFFSLSFCLSFFFSSLLPRQKSCGSYVSKHNPLQQVSALLRTSSSMSPGVVPVWQLWRHHGLSRCNFSH